MKLEKLILINWGFVVSSEYPFGNATLLSGSTGVGKSSFQDAIQLIMTGGKQHINVFNSAQDEVGAGGRAGGKVRRTLATYAIGMRDIRVFNRRFTRRRTLYIALLARPGQGAFHQHIRAVANPGNHPRLTGLG